MRQGTITPVSLLFMTLSLKSYTEDIESDLLIKICTLRSSVENERALLKAEI
jgi:hypothetical protein